MNVKIYDLGKYKDFRAYENMAVNNGCWHDSDMSEWICKQIV